MGKTAEKPVVAAAMPPGVRVRSYSSCSLLNHKLLKLVVEIALPHLCAGDPLLRKSWHRRSRGFEPRPPHRALHPVKMSNLSGVNSSKDADVVKMRKDRKILEKYNKLFFSRKVFFCV